MTINIKPEFQVEKITGKFVRTVTVLEETTKTRMVAGVEKHFTTRKMVPKLDHFTEGYMVYYPQGHSIFIAADDEDQLANLHILGEPKRVDMESGEEVPEDFELTPKQIVERKEKNRPRPASTVGGIAAAME